METLTIADIYAVKSQAKEKEAHYRMTKAYVPQHDDIHQYWVSVLNKADAELEKRIRAIA